MSLNLKSRNADKKYSNQYWLALAAAKRNSIKYKIIKIGVTASVFRISCRFIWYHHRILLKLHLSWTFFNTSFHSIYQHWIDNNAHLHQSSPHTISHSHNHVTLPNHHHYRRRRISYNSLSTITDLIGSTSGSIVVESDALFTGAAAASSTLITHNHIHTNINHILTPVTGNTNANTTATWHQHITSQTIPIVSFLINSIKSIIPLCHHARYLCAVNQRNTSPSNSSAPHQLSLSNHSCDNLPQFAHASPANNTRTTTTAPTPSSPSSHIALSQASAGNKLYLNLTGHRLDDHRVYRRLLVQLEETERRFDEFWTTHLARLKQCLDLRRFEQDFRELQVRIWRSGICRPFEWPSFCLLADLFRFAFESGVGDDRNRRDGIAGGQTDLGNKGLSKNLRRRYWTGRRGGRHRWVIQEQNLTSAYKYFITLIIVPSRPTTDQRPWRMSQRSRPAQMRRINPRPWHCDRAIIATLRNTVQEPRSHGTCGEGSFAAIVSTGSGLIEMFAWRWNNRLNADIRD